MAFICNNIFVIFNDTCVYVFTDNNLKINYYIYYKYVDICVVTVLFSNFKDFCSSLCEVILFPTQVINVLLLCKVGLGIGSFFNIHLKLL